MTRNPYPFPRLEGDNEFRGEFADPIQSGGVPIDEAQKQDPWKRLNAASTLTSSRREVFHHDPKAPRDSLDFVLKARYNHHQEFLKAGNETLVQPETVGEDHGRILKNRTIYEPPAVPDLNHPLRTAEELKKESVHSIKKAIDGHHTQTTNRGYSRKPDGGFFTS